MKIEHLKNVGVPIHGVVQVSRDHDDNALPIKLVIDGKIAWISPADVRRLRKVLKPFAAPKVGE